MAKISQGGQPGGGGSGTYEESIEEREGWKKLREYIRKEGIVAGDTFTVKGAIGKIRLDGIDSAPRYYTKLVKNDKGEEKDWPFVKVYTSITDPRFGRPGLLSPPVKNVGASFFDGKTRQGRSPNRGGMYNIHVAATAEEPSQALKDGQGDWDTDDYENKPLLLRLEYQGKEDPDSQYADRRAGMRIFVAGFEKDRDVHRPAEVEGEDDAPFDRAESAAVAEAQVRKEEATRNADMGSQRATERQMRFIYAIGREAGMDEDAVNDWSLELYAREVDQLNRRDASTLIDALQRRRNETRPADEGGTDEVVDIKAAATRGKVAVTDDDSF
jgi:hypothetical protein